jgi:hemolysin III
MQTLPKIYRRMQSEREEIANSISHGIGLIAALVATPFLILRAIERDDTGFIVGASVFATTMMLLYLASTLYHALPEGNHKRLFRVIEHSAIFLLIAGTYTPFTLGVLRGDLGLTLLIMIWSLAAAGVLLKVLNKMSHPIISTGLYLIMGWLILPMVNYIPESGLQWLLVGGIAYTVGVIFFAAGSHIRYGHFIWHLFVMAGTICHYFAVLWYAA